MLVLFSESLLSLVFRINGNTLSIDYKKKLDTKRVQLNFVLFEQVIQWVIKSIYLNKTVEKEKEEKTKEIRNKFVCEILASKIFVLFYKEKVS